MNGDSRHLVLHLEGSSELVSMDDVIHWLEHAELDEVTSFRDQAEALRFCTARAGKGLRIQNQAAELKLRAERKAGSLLSTLHLRGGDRKSKLHRVTLMLDELGISKIQSCRWQKIASVPEEMFEEYVRRSCESGVELSSAAVLRLAHRLSTEKTRNGKNGSQPLRRCEYKLNMRSVTAHSDHVSTLGSAHELKSVLDDLIGHTQGISSILNGILTGKMQSLRPIEQKTAQRYLSEMAELLQFLASSLVDNADTCQRGEH